MKILIFSFILILFAFSAFSQRYDQKKDKERIIRNKIKSQIQWEHDYVSGKVKQTGYKSIYIKYDKKGNIIEEIHYKFNGTISRVLTYKYDNKGNKIEYINYQGGDRKKILYKQSIKYDLKGNKLEEAGFDGISNYKISFQYDKNNRISVINYYNSNNKIIEKRVFKYVDNQTGISVYRQENIISSRITNKYNNNGDIIEKVIYNEDNNVTKKTLSKYDTKKRIIEVTEYAYGKFSNSLTYKYNAKGNLFEVFKKNQKGENYIDIRFKYDINGNLVEELWYSGKPQNYSKKNYRYDEKGILNNIDCYYATYQYKVLYKFVYEFYE